MSRFFVNFAGCKRYEKLLLTKKKMNPFLIFCKNMVQLVLSPTHGWEDVADEPEQPQVLLEKGFYPLLALVGVTAMTNGLYHPEPYSYVLQLQTAIAQVVALFVSMMLARAAFEAILPNVAGCPEDKVRFNTVCIYGISLMALIEIIGNLSPTPLAALWFLPIFIVPMIWQARNYLQVAKERQAAYLLVAFLTIIAMPVFFGWLLRLLIIR